MMIKITRIFTYFLAFLIIANCGIYKKTDARKVPVNAQERARKNVEEGRGVALNKLKDIGRSGTYEFSTSNPMWRASLEILDFLPLSTVDYSGGVIITDWYNDTSTKNDSIKITLRFLSNEIQTNSLKIIVHRKQCSKNLDCVIKKIESKIEEELTRSILSKAAAIEVADKKKKK